MELPTEIIISITQDIVNEYNEYYFTIHPRAKKKPIAKPYFTTLNEMLLLNNKAIKNAKKQEQQEFVKFILEKYELWDLKIKSCCLHVKFCYNNRIRHDLDNSICIISFSIFILSRPSAFFKRPLFSFCCSLKNLMLASYASLFAFLAILALA